MKTKWATAAGALALFASAAFGQLAGESLRTGPGGQVTASASFNLPRYSAPVVAGAPYSAEQVFEFTQTLADGTRIVEEATSLRMYRDSAGRTRIERPFMRRSGAGLEALKLVEIQDPVAGLFYILDTVNRVAHRSALAPPPPGATVPPTGFTGAFITGGFGPSSPPRMAGGPGPMGRTEAQPEMSVQDLGAREIDGVVAEGRRMTRTYAAGVMGNDRPLSMTTEIWNSPELRMTVLSKIFDPRTGERVTRLKDLSRRDPEPGYFQPPPDYQIVDETGPFTITVTRP